MSEARKPDFKLESFPLKVAAWKNTGAGDRAYYSVKLTKVFKNEGGQWQDTPSLTDRDLPTAAALLLEAWRNLAVKEPKEKDAAPVEIVNPF